MGFIMPAAQETERVWPMDSVFQGLTGRIVLPGSPLYNEARQEWNRAIQQYPVVIDYCQNEGDVSNAVLWAREHRVPIRIRSGGHNYEGYSNGNCTLVIDISEMNAMEIDECEGMLHTQAGVTNGQVYGFVSSRGYPFPGGTCPTVGVSGFVSGGGWGLSCRMLGLGCDSLVEIKVVNFEGRVLTANRVCNADLFWACRGAGGGNFGIITAMTFRLPPKVDLVTLIEIDYLHVSPREQVRFLQTWQHWLKTADDRMTLIARIYNSPNDGLAMLVRGIFYGEPGEARQILKCFLALDNAESSLEYVSFLEAVTVIGSSYPPFEKFQSFSRFALRELTVGECEALANIISRPPQGSAFAGVSLYALGGRVARTDVDDTAFFYRRAGYILWLETVWEDNRFARENADWISLWFPCLASMAGGSYVNFPYNGLPCYLEEYYGAHAEMLRKIKEKYDPDHVFAFPQGIGGYGIMRHAWLEDGAFDETGELPETRTDTFNHRGFQYVRKQA